MDLARLQEVMDHVKSAHAHLMQTLQSLRDEDVPRPSLLPDWSRGHLLTHVARNADSHARMLCAAILEETVEQYEGGKQGRAAQIEAGAGRSAAELVADVDVSATALFELWDEVPEATWHAEVVAIHGEQPAWATLWSRWRETEIHHCDLDLSYSPDDWPGPFVAATLPHLAETLETRGPDAAEMDVRATDMDFTAVIRRPRSSSGEHTIVEAPGRALLAWLAGRPLPASAGAIALPELGPWI